MDGDRQPSRRVLTRGSNSDDARGRRKETSVQLRREKKGESMMKRRFNVDKVVPPEITDGTSRSEDISNLCSEERFKLVCHQTGALESWLNVAISLMSSSARFHPDVLPMIRFIRQLLSRQNVSYMDLFASKDLVTQLVYRLPETVQESQNPDSKGTEEIMFDAAWALTNIASSQYTSIVVDCFAIPRLINLLSSSSIEAREQGAWCLGNIAGDTTAYRDHLIELGIFTPLIQNVYSCLKFLVDANIRMSSIVDQSELVVQNKLIQSHLELLRNTIWAISNLSRCKPVVELHLVKPVIPVVLEVIMSNLDEASVVDALWALSYISDGNSDRIAAVLEHPSTVAALVNVISLNPNGKSTIPAIRTLGNFVSGDDEQTQAVINSGVIPILLDLLKSPDSKRVLRKEVCWVLSNIAAGNFEQRCMLVSSGELIPLMLNRLADDHSVAREASWVLANLLVRDPNIYRDPNTLVFIKNICETLCNAGFIRLVSNLRAKDEKILFNMLEILNTIYDMMAQVDPIAARKQFINDGIADFLRSLENLHRDTQALVNRLQNALLDETELDFSKLCLPMFEDPSTWDHLFQFRIAPRNLPQVR